MENLVSDLKYPASFVTSVILKNSGLYPKELNELYPAVSLKQFALNRARLERKGLVNQLEKIVDVYDDLNGFSNEMLKEIIYDNITLTPKQLNALYPEVSVYRFNAVRHWLPEIKFANRIVAKERQIEVLRSKADKSVGNYKDKKILQKQMIRIAVAEYIKDSGVTGLIGCLPHIDWNGEVVIEKTVKGNTYLGVANNKYVHEAMQIKQQVLEMKHDIVLKGDTVLGDMYEVLTGYGENSFAHLNLDFCGVLPTQGKTVKYVIDNNLIQVGGYMFLTFQKNVRYVKFGYADLFKKFCKENDKSVTGISDCEYGNDKLLKHFLGENYNLELKIPYQTGSAMVFYAVKRIK